MYKNCGFPGTSSPSFYPTFVLSHLLPVLVQCLIFLLSHLLTLSLSQCSVSPSFCLNFLLSHFTSVSPSLCLALSLFQCHVLPLFCITFSLAQCSVSSSFCLTFFLPQCSVLSSFFLAFFLFTSLSQPTTGSTPAVATLVNRTRWVKAILQK